MKILSMNVHSLIEPDEGAKLERFAQMVRKEQPDLIGLQEVDQTRSAPVAGEASEDYVACRGREGERRSPLLLRQDNYALRLALRLRALGTPYHWTWIPVKLGYGKYDEGLALFSKTPILDTDRFFISRSQDYENWKTREILGLQTQAEGYGTFWAYTVHMGWWDDEEEPFKAQWEQVEKGLETKLAGPLLWLMGDFNSPAQVRGEGYDLIAGWGWRDTYQLAKEKDSGITVDRAIDGWRDKLIFSGNDKDRTGEDGSFGMRIDHIWCSREVEIGRSEVVCDGRRYPKVSDHHGVMVTVG